MRKTPIIKLLILFLLTTILFSCHTEETGPEFSGETAFLSGIVTDMQGSGIAGVIVSSGNDIATTDSEGKFVLDEAPVGEKVKVNANKEGFVSTQKLAHISKERDSYLEIAISEIGKTIQINTENENEIQHGNAVLTIPPNSLIDSDGKIFMGIAEAQITYFDPLNEQFVNSFPGDFSGLDLQGQQVQIASLGYIEIEIKNGDELLNLADGKTAKLKFTVDQKLASKAPSSVPFWYYDYEEGNWKEYAMSNKAGNEYEGEVPHFSTINLDMKVDELSEVEGRVVDHEGNPLSNAKIKLTGIDFARSGTGYTDKDGTFKFINVAANSEIQLTAFYGGFYSDPLSAQSPGDAQKKDVGDIEIFIDPNLISGWQEQFNENNFISNLHFIDEKIGFALVNYKGIIKTTNSGKDWNLIYNFSNLNNDTLDFELVVIDEMNSFLVGRHLMKSTDGCQSFSEINTPENYYSYSFFLSENKGWIGFNGSLYKTENGGTSWDEIDLSSMNLKYLNFVHFIDDMTGFLSNYSKLFRTEDGGNQWTEIDLNQGQYLGMISDMFFLNSQTGWLIAGGREVDAKIYKTIDGGQTWQEQTNPAIGSLNELFFYDQDNGWAVGSDGAIIGTSDGGSNWDNQFSGTNLNFRSVFFVTKNKGCISGGDHQTGKIFYTETGGKPL